MDNIMHEYEQIANMVLDKNEGIFIIVPYKSGLLASRLQSFISFNVSL